MPNLHRSGVVGVAIYTIAQWATDPTRKAGSYVQDGGYTRWHEHWTPIRTMGKVHMIESSKQSHYKKASV